MEMWTQIRRPEEDQTSTSPPPFLHPCLSHMQHPSGWMEPPPLAAPSHQCSNKTLLNHLRLLLSWGMERNTCSKALRHLIFTWHQTIQNEPNHPLKGPVSHCSLRKQLSWSPTKFGEMKFYTLLLSIHHTEVFFPALELTIKTSPCTVNIQNHASHSFLDKKQRRGSTREIDTWPSNIQNPKYLFCKEEYGLELW